MDDLVRRAMMGDQQAQVECTRRGITLPCPKCFGPVKVAIIKYDRSGVEMEYKCQRCKLSVRYTQPFIMDDSASADLSALSQWNRMSAPPIGRCKDCANWDKEHRAGRESLGNYVCVCHEWSDEEYGHMRYTPFDGFCNNFEPKEEPNNEE